MKPPLNSEARALGHHNETHHPREIETQCEEWGRANRSDPFARSCARMHYRLGIATPTESYFVTWTTETRTAPDGKPYRVKVPHSMKRP